MSLLNYEPSSEWLNQSNNFNNTENIIDYFFTQRKVNDMEEYIDDKTLERKKKTICHTFNFLAINFPIAYFKNYTSLNIDIEIWGDMMFNYKGTIVKHEGELPHLMIKLKEDKIIFVKLTFKDGDKLNKTYITFITVNKRYQHTIENDGTDAT